MITATNPPEGEPEGEDQPEPVPCPGRLALCGAPCGCRGLNESHYPAPLESTRRIDRYIDDKFLAIFAHEDRNGALSRIFTEGLSQNDNGARWAPITSWRDWWQRAKRAEDHR